MNTLYLRSLSRPATAEETALAGELIGQPGDALKTRQQGWEDLLWMLFVNPEFQFIR